MLEHNDPSLGCPHRVVRVRCGCMTHRDRGFVEWGRSAATLSLPQLSSTASSIMPSSSRWKARATGLIPRGSQLRARPRERSNQAAAGSETPRPTAQKTGASITAPADHRTRQVGMCAPLLRGNWIGIDIQSTVSANRPIQRGVSRASTVASRISQSKCVDRRLRRLGSRNAR